MTKRFIKCAACKSHRANHWNIVGAVYRHGNNVFCARRLRGILEKRQWHTQRTCLEIIKISETKDTSKCLLSNIIKRLVNHKE